MQQIETKEKPQKSPSPKTTLTLKTVKAWFPDRLRNRLKFELEDGKLVVRVKKFIPDPKIWKAIHNILIDKGFDWIPNEQEKEKSGWFLHT